MSFIRKRKSKFTQVHNTLLNDERLSFKAIGLFCYMYSKPDKWNFTIQSIANQMKDGKDSVKSALKELKEFGYISYKRKSDGTGEYFLDDQPNAENPHAENPHAENPHAENPHAENPHVLVIKNISNKDLYKERERETRALDFFEENYPSQHENFCRNYKSKIKKFQKFTADFNDVFDTEKLEYDDRVISGRLNRYARNWIENQDRYSKTEKDETPVYRKKIT